MNTGDFDMMQTPTGKGADPDDVGTDEEQFGLIPLLQQMSLSELREIARQRGWRVKGTSKADYVAALAPLLCDLTETARAVTQMPAELLEALRAALVADDGSGITPTIMAQTVTALRSGSAATHETWDTTRRPGTQPVSGERAESPAIKPVEAAALLMDLARWGLVLPWRDSLYGHGRHVLPWQIQRLLPPLPGWCPSSDQTPALVRSRDPRQFVNLLYALWESIAEQRPALSRSGPLRSDGAPAEAPVERRLQSLLQGWPYDPQELQGWARTRRWAESTTQSLLVLPPGFLLEDTALSTLSSLLQSGGQGLGPGEREEAEFVCRLLCEMGLVSIQSGHLLAHRENMANFLRRPVAEQHRAAAQAYVSLVDWSELDVLLRSDTRLALWRRPYFGLAYDQFRSWLVRLRHLILRFLACAGEEGWCELADIEAALRQLWPHFPVVLQSERESWLSQAWGLAWRPEERGPETADSSGDRNAQPPLQSEAPWTVGRSTGPAGSSQQSGERASADWEASQGALLRVMLEGPLYWLGFVELGYRNGRDLDSRPGAVVLASQHEEGPGKLAAVRFRGLANWVWGRPAVWFDREGWPPEEVVNVDEASAKISVQPGLVAPRVHAFLGRIARLEEASPERFLYHLQPRAAWRAFENGLTLSDLVAEWDQVMPRPIPKALQDMLSQWWADYGQVRLYDGFALLELRDEVSLRELEAATSLRKHILARLSPRMVLISNDAVDGLLREFAAKGYAPKEVE